MALTCGPVHYQTCTFNPVNKFDHEFQQDSDNYFTKDPSFSLFSQVPSMEGFKIKHKAVLNDMPPPQLISWTRKHPQHWTRKEVLDWIYFVVDQEHLDGSKLQGEAYNSFVGEDLCQMDRQQFLEADPYYGSKMYDTFRNLVNDVSFEKPQPALDVANLDTFNAINHSAYMCFNWNIDRGVTGRGGTACDNSHNNDLLVYHSDDNDIKVSLQGLGEYSIDTDVPLSNSADSILPPKLKQGESFTKPLVPFSPSSHQHESSSLSSSRSSLTMQTYTRRRSSSASMNPSRSSHALTSSRKMSSSPRMQHPSSLHSSSTSSLREPTSSLVTLSGSMALPQGSKPSALLSSSPRLDALDYGYLSDDSSSPLHQYQQSSFNHIYSSDIHQSPMRVPGLLSENRVAPRKKDKKNRNNATKNGNHLWEFVRDLLRDPETNPKLLKWEDKDHGVFRFVQSEKVAQLWGEKKNNPMMTYEKLSRAMRFCRTAGYFDIVPKTGKFPKKLCFRFGEKAHGWKD